MATTVKIQIIEQGGLLSTGKETSINVTRSTKALAIAEAIAMVAAAHRPELERAWSDLVAQVEPLLATYRESLAEAAEVSKAAEDDGSTAATD